MTRWRIKHVLIAAVLLTIELAQGLGMIGLPAVFIAAVVLFGGNQRVGMWLQSGGSISLGFSSDIHIARLQRAHCQT